MGKLLLSCVAFVAVAIASTRSFPFHASCTVDWVFKVPCEKVNTALVNQIKKWASDDNCKQHGGEKCLYHLKSSSASEIKVVHETPKAHYFDDISFTFNDASGICKMHGHSSSEIWYAVFDKGTNYCNMENLITGSGVNKFAGYNETTSDSECTQYSSSNCDVY